MPVPPAGRQRQRRWRKEKSRSKKAVLSTFVQLGQGGFNNKALFLEEKQRNLCRMHLARPCLEVGFDSLLG